MPHLFKYCTGYLADVVRVFHLPTDCNMRYIGHLLCYGEGEDEFLLPLGMLFNVVHHGYFIFLFISTATVASCTH